jgi:hypothetical protein
MQLKLLHVVQSRVHCYNFFYQNLSLNLFEYIVGSQYYYGKITVQLRSIAEYCTAPTSLIF